MSNTAANFFNRVGLLIPGFKGYKTKEELRDSDYKIRLFTQNTVEIFIQKIEKYKRELDSDELLEVDFQQKDLKIFSVKVANQKFGYKAFFGDDSSEDSAKLLEMIVEHDKSLIDLLQEANEVKQINLEFIKTLNDRLNNILHERAILLG